MMKNVMLLATALMIVTGAQQSAHAVEADDAITYRKEVMEALGAHTSGVALIAQGKINDPKALAAHADMLARSAGLALAAFKDNTTGKGKEKTEAKPEIWAKWPEFEKDMKALEAQAQKLASAAASGGAKGALAELPALSKTCKTCHESFRKKD